MSRRIDWCHALTLLKTIVLRPPATKEPLNARAAPGGDQAPNAEDRAAAERLVRLREAAAARAAARAAALEARREKQQRASSLAPASGGAEEEGQM